MGMKVSELIEALSAYYPDADVELLNDSEWGLDYLPLQTVEAAGGVVRLDH